VQVIVESAYGLECEVVREIGAHSAIDVVSYATNVCRLIVPYTRKSAPRTNPAVNGSVRALCDAAGRGPARSHWALASAAARAYDIYSELRFRDREARMKCSELTR
jgi:hypothetical protein